MSNKFWENSTLSLMKNLRDEIWSTNFSSPVVTAFLCKLYCHFYDLITPWMTFSLKLCLMSYRDGFILQFRVSGLQLVLPFEVSLYTSTYFTTLLTPSLCSPKSPSSDYNAPPPGRLAPYPPNNTPLPLAYPPSSSISGNHSNPTRYSLFQSNLYNSSWLMPLRSL